jgi:hypothetical protein
VEAYLLSLSIGDDVYLTGLMTAITSVVENPKQPAFLLATLTVGETGSSQGTTDVVIPYDGVASVGTVSVTEVT